MREAVDGEARTVLLERSIELREHRRAMLRLLHVDEVDDDDAAEIAQPQLARDHLRRLEVGLEDRVVEAAPAHEAAGVDVDRGHRLGLVDDEVAARLQIDAPPERLLDLVLDAVQVEQRPLAGVVRDALGERRRVFARELLHAHERLARVDHHARRLLRGHVAQHALREGQVLIQQIGGGHLARTLVQVAPELGEVLDVVAHLAIARGLGHRADDEAAGRAFGQELRELLAQDLALRLVLDALRDPDVRILRQEHEQASREAHLRRQARTLGADRVLDHLHEKRLAFVQDLLDGAGVGAAVAVLAVLPDVGDVQERCALEPDLDECALHAGQHARHAAEVDVADEPPRTGTLDVQLLHDALLEHRDAGFLRRYVDEDLMAHADGEPASCALRCSRLGKPGALARCPK